jgi:hypothetical protein
LLAGHAGPTPQPHLPLLHTLERPSHAAHIAPASPQVLKPHTVQDVPVQQPLLHEVASQTHWPFTHR